MSKRSPLSRRSDLNSDPGRSRRRRRNPTKQPTFDQHSRLRVAIERLTNRRPPPVGLTPSSAGCTPAMRGWALGGCPTAPVGSTPSSAGCTPPNRGWTPAVNDPVEPRPTAVKWWSGALHSRTLPLLRKRGGKGTVEMRRPGPASAEGRIEVRRCVPLSEQGAHRRIAVGNIAPVTGVVTPLLA
jgi:hypothetical protein